MATLLTAAVAGRSQEGESGGGIRAAPLPRTGAEPTQHRRSRVQWLGRVLSESIETTPWLVPKTDMHADGDRFQSNAGRVCVRQLVRSEGAQVDRADAAAPASHSTERAAQGRMLKAWVFTQALIPMS
jgi:hypothetical protein